MKSADNANQKKEYKNIFGYTLLTLLIVFLVHTILSSLVKQALKLAIMSEMIGIAMALTVVSLIMLALYFAGRKYISKKELMPVRLYRFLSAEFPVVIWLGIMIFRIYSAVSDFDIRNSDINIETVLNILKSAVQIINSVISFISSLMVLVSAWICEIAGIIKKMLKAEEQK